MNHCSVSGVDQTRVRGMMTILWAGSPWAHHPKSCVRDATRQGSRGSALKRGGGADWVGVPTSPRVRCAAQVEVATRANSAQYSTTTVESMASPPQTPERKDDETLP
jgi:hypothetical protein